MKIFMQVILPLLKNDLYEVIQATIDGKLCSFMPAWSENSTAVCVVMASPGYPGDYDKGMEVTGNLRSLFTIYFQPSTSESLHLLLLPESCTAFLHPTPRALQNLPSSITPCPCGRNNCSVRLFS